jgi:hypothetical protein
MRLRLVVKIKGSLESARYIFETKKKIGSYLNFFFLFVKVLLTSKLKLKSNKKLVFKKKKPTHLSQNSKIIVYCKHKSVKFESKALSYKTLL